MAEKWVIALWHIETSEYLNAGSSGEHIVRLGLANQLDLPAPTTIVEYDCVTDLPLLTGEK
ncbi:MAG TPA: hypothetical protein VK667_07385 [Ktedonobacteraceae bacterium]|nr:hypothetical protein [Ktedonobacteraceae bacterium]